MRVLTADRIGLLGTPALITEDGPVPLRLQPKALALLGYVATAGRPVSRRDLARLLFPDADDARGALRWQLTRLRSALPRTAGRHLRIEREEVALALATDVAAFRAAAERVLASFDPQAARAAIELYRGDFLSGLAATTSTEFDTWLYLQEESLRTLFRRVTLAFARWAIDGGHPDEALEPLARLVALDPYAEEGHVMRVEALLALGAEERARAAYGAYAQLMRDDLHAEPRAELAARFEKPHARTERSLPREGFATLREVTLHFVDWPGGDPPLLCLHGATSTCYVYGGLAHKLAPDFRLVAPDLRGTGFSDKPPAAYTVRQHVEDLVELCTALRLDRPILVGHSAGGAVATLAAERVGARGLVLLDGVVGERPVVESRLTVAAPILDATRTRYPNFARYLELMRASRSSMSPDEELLVDQMARSSMTRMPDGSYRMSVYTDAVKQTWRSLIESDTIGALRRLTCPVLVVWATQPWLIEDEQPYFNEEIVRAQAAAARDGSLIVAARSTHARLVRDPEPAVIEAVRRLARAVASPSTGAGLARSARAAGVTAAIAR